MIEPARRARLRVEPLAEGGIMLETRVEDFDRDGRMQVHVPRAVDDPESTLSDALFDGEATAERRPHQISHSGSRRRPRAGVLVAANRIHGYPCRSAWEGLAPTARASLQMGVIP